MVTTFINEDILSFFKEKETPGKMHFAMKAVDFR